MCVFCVSSEGEIQDLPCHVKRAAHGGGVLAGDISTLSCGPPGTTVTKFSTILMPAVRRWIELKGACGRGC